MKDFEDLYYETYFKYKQKCEENEKLKEEIELLKKYSKKSDIKQMLIKEIIKRKEVGK